MSKGKKFWSVMIDLSVCDFEWYGNHIGDVTEYSNYIIGNGRGNKFKTKAEALKAAKEIRLIISKNKKP